jgi:hypothetical protein
MPDLDTVVVTGSMFSTDEFFLGDFYQRYTLPGYSSITNYVLDTMARQPNYVETDPTVGAQPQPREDPDLDEVLVEGNEVPLDELRDDELRDLGTDSSIDELNRRRGDLDRGTLDSDDFYDPQDAFLAPTLPKPFTYPGATPDNPTAQPRAPVPRTVPGIPPPELPTVTVLGRFIPYLGPLLGGLAALFFPQPMGPRELDEAPWWELPPLRAKPAPKPKPVRTLPREDPELPEVIIEQPRYDPVPRRVAPIGDNPGLFVDPFQLPEGPSPYFDPTPDTTTAPRPSEPQADPYSPPLADPFVDPTGDPKPKPRVPDETYEPGDPTDPDVNRPGDPFVPPDPFDIYGPLLPPTFSPFPQPPDTLTQPRERPILADPSLFVPDPDRRDCKCDPCKDKKDKKKKKKSNPRSVCYEGHYIEHERGLTKVRGKEIPCEAGSSTRAPRRKVPRIPGDVGGLARDVFGLPP